MKRFGIFLMCFMVLSIFAPLSGVAADYPNKVIKVVVPFSAGGETDIVARLLAKELEQVLDNSVVVQNISGASGMIGCRTIANSKPNGYTLGVIPAAPLAMHPHMRKVPYTYESFDYIGRVVKSPYMIFVNKKATWDTVSDMIKDMKANPGKYHWGSAGVGSVPYFAGKGFFGAFDVDVKHVPFTGDAEALQAMAGDRISVYFTTAGVLEKYNVKALAILDSERSEFNPDIPSIKEAGKEVYISQWMPLVGPDGLQKNVLETLSDALHTVCTSKNFKKSMKKLGLGIAYLPPEETHDFVTSESAKNKKNIEAMMKKE